MRFRQDRERHVEHAEESRGWRESYANLGHRCAVVDLGGRDINRSQ